MRGGRWLIFGKGVVCVAGVFGFVGLVRAAGVIRMKNGKQTNSSKGEFGGSSVGGVVGGGFFGGGGFVGWVGGGGHGAVRLDGFLVEEIGGRVVQGILCGTSLKNMEYFLVWLFFFVFFWFFFGVGDFAFFSCWFCFLCMASSKPSNKSMDAPLLFVFFWTFITPFPSPQSATSCGVLSCCVIFTMASACWASHGVGLRSQSCPFIGATLFFSATFIPGFLSSCKISAVLFFLGAPPFTVIRFFFVNGCV